MTTNPITSLSARNYKGVREVTIQPEGRTLVVVAGANGAGKSSFIDAIAEIIDPKGTRLTAKPIREGEASASAELVTEKFTATRKWTKDDAGTLKVVSNEGATYGKGRDFLVEQTGAALLEPFAFDALKDAEQRAELLSRVELPFNLDELERRYSVAYTARTDQKRELDRRVAVLSALPEPVEGAGDEVEQSAAELVKQIQRANEWNDTLGNEVRRSDRLTAEKADLEAKLAAVNEELDRVNVWLSDAHPQIDVTGLGAQLESIEETNAQIRARKSAADAWQKASKDVEEAETAWAALDAQIDSIRQTKADGLAKAKFPVEGLSVDSDRILFDGLPFKQINSAKRIAIAFELAASAHPGLRIAIIRNGDMLDDDTLAQVEAVAQKHEYLVLVERDRGNSREIGFTVAEGELSS